MRDRLSRAVTAVAMLLAVGLLLPSTANAQRAQRQTTLETHPTREKGAPAEPAPAVGDLAALNGQTDRAETTGQPRRKGGGRSKGAGAYAAEFHIDNRTDYFMNCFFNGRYAGSIAPYGDLYFNVTYGSARVACYAPGTDSQWGPTSVEITGNYTWRLWQN
jgi:hypothetical protein